MPPEIDIAHTESVTTMRKNKTLIQVVSWNDDSIDVWRYDNDYAGNNQVERARKITHHPNSSTVRAPVL